jgi:hypothetical protein
MRRGQQSPLLAQGGQFSGTVARKRMASGSKSKVSKNECSVPEAWRRIVKLNEKQGSRKYDVLICGHSVAASDTVGRRFRACPECRVKVQQIVNEHDRGDQAA